MTQLFPIILQDLPKTTPVTIKLPSELFGDMMMVLEFLNVFGNLFDMKDEFPSGLTFGKPINLLVLDQTDNEVTTAIIILDCVVTEFIHIPST